MLVLIDADPIVYRCGFAAEKTEWHVIYQLETDSLDIEPREIHFSPDETNTANELMKRWIDSQAGKITIVDKSKVITPDPLAYALRAVKVQVESIMEECEAHHKEGGKMLMYLSGKGGSYRDKIAKVRPYKGNRDPAHKPYHYDAIRDYLRAQYKSLMTSGIEADDALSIFAHNHYERGTPERLVIATIDKDLDQIPGHHYNYMHKVFYAITPAEAERFFVYQILAGDPTDNIIGVWRCGESAASRIADRFTYDGRNKYSAELSQSGKPAGKLGSRTPGHTAPAPDASHVPDHGNAGVRERTPSWWPTVLAEYAASQRKPGCPYAQNNPETVAIEMAQLVKLQEYPGQLWHPHGDLVVEGFGEENFD